MRVIVGDETGLVKEVQLEKEEENKLGTQEGRDGIQCMCWGNVEESRVAVAARSGIVKTYRLGTSTEHPLTSVDTSSVGRFVGMGVLADGRSVISCTEEGTVKMMPADDSEATEFEVGSPVSRMRLGADVRSVIGVGGKEKDFELWQIDTQTMVFKAKNVKQDFLDLRVPVWITDFQFFPSTSESNPKVISGTAHSQVRLYDTKAQRRPIHSVDLGEYAVSAVCLTPDETQVIVGDSTGMLSCFDLRNWKRLGRLMGPHGAIEDLSCHPTLPYVASVGLDRYLRVFNWSTHKEKGTYYMRQRLSTVLFADDLEVKVKKRKDAATKASQNEGESSDSDESGDEYDGLEVSDDEEEDEEEEEDDNEDEEEEDEFEESRPKKKRG